MARVSIDLEPLCRLYPDGHDLQKALIKHSLAIESAGADGVVISTGEDYDAGRKKALSILAESLDMNLSVKTTLNEQWTEALGELKPAMVIFSFDGNDDEFSGDLVTRFQIENILVGFEIKPQIELVKTVGRLKGDFVIIDCQAYCQAATLNAQVEEINKIARTAALGSKLSMGVVASGDFSNRRLQKLARTKTIEEFFIGLPVLGNALVDGYNRAIKSIFPIISDNL
jgi:pyridoxine 5'-phosphate synthase PdxJ